MLYLTLQSKAYIQHSPKLNKALSAHPTTSTNTYVSKAKCAKKDEKIESCTNTMKPSSL